jgi:hypothetical protein
MGTFWSIVNALGPLAGLIAILSFATWVVSTESHKKEVR